MDTKKRFELVKSVGEEVVTDKELRELLEKKKNPIAYDGFEPSGNVHIAQGVMRAININKMTKAGIKFKMLVADWHAMANNKMGGDLDVIQKVGKYLIEKLADIPVFVELASEYRYFARKNKSSLVIGITQSGETLDTLAALREAKNSGCRTLVVTNVIGSSATRISDEYILMQSGPEIGVAATKTFTSQILILLFIALKIGIIKNKISADELYEYIHILRELPRKVRDVLDNDNKILKVAKQLKNAKSIFFIGRGINYPLSLEGALKLKEISYIHAEGFAAGELKHGPFALLTKDTPVVVITTKDTVYDKTLTSIGEVKARGSQVIAIAEESDTEIEKFADIVLRVPGNSNILSSIPIIVVLQLLAYHVANLRKCSIDKPRNLAKSVTVE